MKKADKQIYIDRDLHASGLLSMYQDVERELFGAIESGTMVELIDGGTGKTSADVDLIEVGNTTANGNVPKYINGIMTNIILNSDSMSHKEIKDGDEIAIGDTETLQLQVTVVNTEKSMWLKGNDYGSVSLCSLEASDYSFNVPLLHDIHSLESVTFSIAIPIDKKGTLSFALYAKDRTYFGEKITIKLK